MRDLELTHVTSELRRLVGLPLQGVWQPARDRLVLGFADGTLLLLVPRGPFARMHTVASRPKNPSNPYSFQGAARARLLGPLTDIRKDPHDRIVELEFGSRILHLRLTGRSGGLWLREGDAVIAALDGPAVAIPPAGTAPVHAVEPRFSPGPDGSWDLAARAWFARAESNQNRADRRVEVERQLRAALGRLARLRDGLVADLDKAGESPRFRRMADALAARLYEVRRGARAVVPDLEDPTIEYDIELDPARPPSATMERLYAKARRLDRMGEQVLVRLDEVEARLLKMRDQFELLAWADEAQLKALAATLPKQARSAVDPDRLPWHVWTGPHDETILVGRDAASNRKLTFQKARGNDFWMHVRDKPAAHVVIPADRDHPPPLPILLAAAQIALVHANVPEGATADVQYTRAKYVRSIPGNPGMVTLQDERVLHVRRDPAALQGWRRE